MPPPRQGEAPRTIVVGSFTHDGRHYEQRLVNCGKLACTKCGPPHDRHPSHGPYWYLCISRRGGWTRIYLGKQLDTQRFVGPDGSVDWSLVLARKKRRPKADFTAPASPGQADLVDQTSLPQEAPPPCPSSLSPPSSPTTAPAAVDPGATRPHPKGEPLP